MVVVGKSDTVTHTCTILFDNEAVAHHGKGECFERVAALDVAHALLVEAYNRTVAAADHAPLADHTPDTARVVVCATAQSLQNNDRNNHGNDNPTCHISDNSL